MRRLVPEAFGKAVILLMRTLPSLREQLATSQLRVGAAGRSRSAVVMARHERFSGEWSVHQLSTLLSVPIILCALTPHFFSIWASNYLGLSSF